jgi:hypothetical protein
MAVRNYCMGQINAIVYFENSRGVIALPPSTDYALMVKDRMRHRGFELREARNLPEIDRLQKKMEEQEYRNCQAQLERDHSLRSRVRARTRSNLMQRMVSSSTSPYERDFIQNYLMLDEAKREKYQQRFSQDQMYFEAREFESGNKRMQDANQNVPDGKDVECTCCRSARRQIGTLCVRCANNVRETAHHGR